jgi:hypothetical protein
LQEIDNTILTPHVGRRTFESVDPKALRAVRNVVGFLKGGKDFIQPTSSSWALINRTTEDTEDTETCVKSPLCTLCPLWRIHLRGTLCQQQQMWDLSVWR